MSLITVCILDVIIQKKKNNRILGPKKVPPISNKNSSFAFICIMQILNLVLVFLAKVSHIYATPILKSTKNILIKNTPIAKNQFLPSSNIFPEVQEWDTIENFRQSLRLAAINNNPKGAETLHNFVSEHNTTCDEVNWYNVIHHSIFGKKRFCSV